MSYNEDHRDLKDVLSEVRRRGTDNRLIWCKPSFDFQTTVAHREGLLLGGVRSPLFLRDAGEGLDGIPWVKRLYRLRIVVCEKATGTVADWLPLMEAIAKAGESLLLVTEQIAEELLQTLIVNSIKGTLPNAVIYRGNDGSVEALGREWSSPPEQTDRVPRAAEAWVRRTGTVVFPEPSGGWRGHMQDVEVISAGGESYDHQLERLRFLVREIQTPVRRF